MQPQSQVKQSLGVAAALIEQYRELVEHLAAAGARGDSDDASTTRAQIERVYASIWEQLDTAAQLTREAGRQARDYDNLRAQTETREAAVQATSERVTDIERKGSKTHITFEHTVHHNDLGLALASQATSSLEDAWPELTWTDDASDDTDLRPGGIHRVVRGIARLFGRR